MLVNVLLLFIQMYVILLLCYILSININILS